MLIPVSLNVKIVGDGDIQLSCAEYRGLNASSVMALINWRIIVSLDSVARQMKELIPLDLKQRKEICVLTHLSVLTVREIIKLTLTNVHSRSTISIENSSRRNMLRSMKTGSSQFALQGAANFHNDCTKP